ncbi:MAG: metal ABC transporter substrate-binding protein [Petrotogales bacterium]
MDYIIKRKYVLFGIVMLLLFSCFSTTLQAEETTINIICTNSALADFTSNLLTENVTIDYIMPAGVCPAQYDTTPSDVDKIISADTLISFGSAKMEGWLGDLLHYNNNCSVIECSYMGEWNIPSGAKKYVEKILDELLLLLPTYNDTIQTNAQAYMAQINETAEELQKKIIDNGNLGKKVICMEWQKDFIEWLGLNVTYFYGSENLLSVQDKLKVSDAASSGDICAVIDNLQSGTEFGAQIASEAGASHIIFTNFPEAVPGTSTYLEMITYNTNQLIDGIATYEYKQGEIAKLENKLSTVELERNASLLGLIILGLLTGTLAIIYKKK